MSIDQENHAEKATHVSTMYRFVLRGRGGRDTAFSTVKAAFEAMRTGEAVFIVWNGLSFPVLRP